MLTKLKEFIGSASVSALVLAVLLIVPATTAATEETNQNAWEAASVLERFMMAATVIPVTLILVGEAWEEVCTRAGFEFAQDKQGFWYCSGIPRRD